jgi:hypothetical protein
VVEHDVDAPVISTLCPAVNPAVVSAPCSVSRPVGSAQAISGASPSGRGRTNRWSATTYSANADGIDPITGSPTCQVSTPSPSAATPPAYSNLAMNSLP